MSIGHKRDLRDVVTEHDKRAETTISGYIFQNVPDSTLLGEEGGSTGRGRVSWFVDPIDGTSNFGDGIVFCCVSGAAAIDCEGFVSDIFYPLCDERFCG